MSKKRKKYTTEFKQEAVNLVTEHGYSYAEAGRSLDVNTSMLRRWHKELVSGGKTAFSGNGKLSPEQQRIRELEKENQRLRMEKEILKKATAFFVKEST